MANRAKDRGSPVVIRDKRVELRMSEHEWKDAHKLASAMGLSLGALVRALVAQRVRQERRRRGKL